MQAEQKHPADELAKTLARANGILTLLSGCYERETGNFATSMSYIHESIVAVETILSKATEAMARLYLQCDLSLVRQIPEALAGATEEMTTDAEVPAEESVTAAPLFTRVSAPHAVTDGGAQTTPSYLGFFGPQESAGKLSDRLDDVLRPVARAPVADPLAGPAQSYDELLAKITAFADRAAYRAHHGQGEGSLVPELEALRADLMKLRNVA